MSRRLFTFAFGAASALSLLLCVASVAMWVRSHRTGDLWVWAQPSDRPEAGRGRRLRCDVISGWGQVQFSRVRLSWPLEPGVHHRASPDTVFTFRKAPGVSLLGFEAGTAIRGGRYWAVPYWALALLSGVAPGAWLWRQRRAQRATARGLCANCGYDLRASPVRCPECGAAAPAGR